MNFRKEDRRIYIFTKMDQTKIPVAEPMSNQNTTNKSYQKLGRTVDDILSIRNVFFNDLESLF